jgi:hypothetical protein
LTISVTHPRGSFRLLLAAALVLLASVTGAAVAWALHTPSNVLLGSPIAHGGSPLSDIEHDSPPLSSQSVAGITVDFQGAARLDASRTVVYYKAHVQDSALFVDMLGVPRIENRDGSVVLPEAYGENGTRSDGSDGVPGLPAESSSAIYETAQIQPGAVVRFGPFFRSSTEGFSVTTSGAALLKGEPATIGGQHFNIVAEASGGMTNIKFLNVDAAPSIMATHPGSVVTVTFGGRPANVVHGSSNFAKDATFEVNANQSSIVVSDDLSSDAAVVISSNSTGSVVHGDWAFALD